MENRKLCCFVVNLLSLADMMESFDTLMRWFLGVSPVNILHFFFGFVFFVVFLQFDCEQTWHVESCDLFTLEENDTLCCYIRTKDFTKMTAYSMETPENHNCTSPKFCKYCF